MSGTPRPRAECIVPILNVADLQASLDYYVDVLGFQHDWTHESESYGIAGISMDGHSIYLCREAEGHPGTWVWLGVEDAEALHTLYVARGARIRQPPTNYSWALEMRVEDPDGHVLRIASEPLEDRPFVPPAP